MQRPPCTMEEIISNYQLLGHSDPIIRETANLFLIGVVDDPNIWSIAQNMITHVSNPDFQLLGSQMLYQRIDRDLDNLNFQQLTSLREFIFIQLTNQELALPTINKLASSASLIAAALYLDHWPTLINDLVKFMDVSFQQLRNGLVFFERFPEQLRATNRIKHGLKLKIREKIMEEADTVAHVLLTAFALNQNVITNGALEVLENWIKISFPLLKYNIVLKRVIELTIEQDGLFLENSCKVISQGLQATSQMKFLTLGQVDLKLQRQAYSPQQLSSIGMIITYLRETKVNFYKAIDSLKNMENIEIYTSIIKELLLSFRFLLLEDVGFELIEFMVKTLQCNDLKLSYSTFQFWIDFSEKLGKIRGDSQLQDKFYNLMQVMFDIILKKTLLQNQTFLFQLINEEDTVDDINSISFNQYRKEAQHIIRFIYEYLTKRKEKEGSTLFFSKLYFFIEADKQSVQVGRGIQLVIYAIKAALESMVKEYDTQNIIIFMIRIIQEVGADPKSLPPRVAAQIMGLIKDCSRQMKENDQLFIQCLSFCLGFVEDEALCHYAVYAFQSLMESIGDLANDGLLNDLMNFYSSKNFTKQIILQKILEGIMNSVTKLKSRDMINKFLTQIMARIEQKYHELMSVDPNDVGESYKIALIEIKILLDVFDNFQPQDKEYYRLVFLRISNQGIVIMSHIIHNHLQRRIKFNNINELGISLMVCKSGLKICEGVSIDQLPIQSYICVMDLIMSLFKTSDTNYFNEYSSLIQIINKVLTQFSNLNIPDLNSWLFANLGTINDYFTGYVAKHSSYTKIDPDILKWYFSIQENVLTYNKEIYLAQPQHQQILQLALVSIKHLNEKNLQRKVIFFIYMCVQLKEVYGGKFQLILRTIFSTIPYVNNICFLNLGRILLILLQNLDIKAKEEVCRRLLDVEPYVEIDRNIKEIMGKFIAYVLETKVERYIKSVLIDLTDIKNKKTGTDLTLNLEMRYISWKKQYARMIKSGETPK